MSKKCPGCLSCSWRSGAQALLSRQQLNSPGAGDFSSAKVFSRLHGESRLDLSACAGMGMQTEVTDTSSCRNSRGRQGGFEAASHQHGASPGHPFEHLKHIEQARCQVRSVPAAAISWAEMGQFGTWCLGPELLFWVAIMFRNFFTLNCYHLTRAGRILASYMHSFSIDDISLWKTQHQPHYSSDIGVTASFILMGEK